MKQKLYHHFLKFGPKRFVIFAVIFLFVLDILNCYYLKLHWTQRGYSDLILKLTLKNGQLTEAELSSDTIVEILKFINNCFYFFIVLIVINNLFFYAFYLRKKLWAQSYILFYTITAAIFSLTFIFDNSGLPSIWMVYNILTIPIYIYLYLGVKLLKKETTHGHEKTAQ